MPRTEFPELAERVETGVCCVYNVTTGDSISTRVGVADLALQPLKALKMLMDGLALDGVSSLWLKALPGPPLMMRLFPFDFVYLDEDLRAIESVELAPNVPFPAYSVEVASALILPLHTLASTGIRKGDQLIICSPEELEHRRSEIAPPLQPPSPASTDLEACLVVVETDASAAMETSLAPEPAPTAQPTPDPPIPVEKSTVSTGAKFTLSLATTWQISGSTMAAVPVPPAEEKIPAESGLAIVEAPEEEIVVGKGVAGVDASAVEEKDAAESSDQKSEPTALVETSIVEVPLDAIEVVAPSGQVAPIEQVDSPAANADAKPQFALTFDQLCQAVAAVEATEPEEITPAGPETPTEDERIARSREAWEKTTVKTARPSVSSPVEPQKKSRDPEKDPSLGTRVIRWLNLEDPLPERRKIIRLLLDGLQAFDADGDSGQRHQLRDVCPIGFCLRTQAKWQRDQLVSLMIEKKDGKDAGQRVRVQARVVRCDEDGTGLEFVFPRGTEFNPWERVKTKRSDETEADFILRELRLSHALGFLGRLSPGGSEQVGHALHDRLSNKRVASAVDVVLLADEALREGGQAELACAHPDIVMHIIESSSWIEEQWIRKLWAGLLVSSCTADGLDTSNQLFIDLLAKLTPLHLRILSFACDKAVEAIAAGRPAKDFSIDCSAEELMEVADSHSFARIQQTVGHLATYGLLAEIKRSSYLTVTEKSKTRLAPTAMGLKMWARCNGKPA